VWDGDHHRAEQLLCHLSFAIGSCASNDAGGKADRFLDELRVYLRRNRQLIPSYNERRLAGEPISSATAEATVNQVIAKRMGQKATDALDPTGAHRLIQSAPEPSTAPSNKPSPHSLPQNTPVSHGAVLKGSLAEVGPYESFTNS
jgi:hypothetical protein